MKVSVNGRRQPFRTVTFEVRHNTVWLIDQRLLPHRFELLPCRTSQATAQAIRDMVVRGAGAIGATAAFGLAQGAREFRGRDQSRFPHHLDQVFHVFQAARPTAVDPLNALRRVHQAMAAGQTVSDQQDLARQAAQDFAEAQVQECADLGRQGARLIRDGLRVLTHCNAGWLAFVDLGSATAPLYTAQAQGREFFVFCDETRPRCQGASLTAWELSQQRVPHAVIADNAAGHLMQRGEIDLVIVGSDRVLGRTGEVANKIGTYTKAVLARRHRITFYVAIPLSTLDWELRSGFDIPIEERSEDEVLGAWGVTRRGRRCYVRIANPQSSARNPGFDVTPAELITGLITPKGIFRPRDLWRERRRLGWTTPPRNA